MVMEAGLWAGDLPLQVHAITIQEVLAGDILSIFWPTALLTLHLMLILLKYLEMKKSGLFFFLLTTDQHCMWEDGVPQLAINPEVILLLWILIPGKLPPLIRELIGRLKHLTCQKIVTSSMLGVTLTLLGGKPEEV